MAIPSVICAPDPGYLKGNWEINTQGTSGDKDVEHLTIRGNNTFEYGRRGKAEAVDFWRIENDVLTFVMLTSPSQFQDIRLQFQDIHTELRAFNQHEIHRMFAVAVDTQKDQFSAVASIGDLMRQFTLQRCQ